MTPTKRKPWSNMSPARRVFTAVAAMVQFGLAGAAWADLVRRPAREVRGPKWRWALVIIINFVGPLSYFRWGRLTALEAQAAESAS
jgi:Phospholipase_D-nuclease N-terminal